MNTNFPLHNYYVIIPLWLMSLIAGYQYLEYKHRHDITELEDTIIETISMQQNKFEAEQQELYDTYNEKLEQKDQLIAQCYAELDQAEEVPEAEPEVVAETTPIATPIATETPAPTKLTIKTPGNGAALCLGATEHIQWEAPAEWDAVRILLQDALTKGNGLIGLAEASEGIFVWTVGEMQSPSRVTPGKYKLDITWQGHDYNANHQVSETFSIIEC